MKLSVIKTFIMYTKAMFSEDYGIIDYVIGHEFF